MDRKIASLSKRHSRGDDFSSLFVQVMRCIAAPILHGMRESALFSRVRFARSLRVAGGFININSRRRTSQLVSSGERARWRERASRYLARGMLINGTEKAGNV